jgi:hypothetical protein
MLLQKDNSGWSIRITSLTFVNSSELRQQWCWGDPGFLKYWKTKTNHWREVPVLWFLHAFRSWCSVIMHCTVKILLHLSHDTFSAGYLWPRSMAGQGLNTTINTSIFSPMSCTDDLSEGIRALEQWFPKYVIVFLY